MVLVLGIGYWIQFLAGWFAQHLIPIPNTQNPILVSYSPPVARCMIFSWWPPAGQLSGDPAFMHDEDAVAHASISGNSEEIMMMATPWAASSFISL